MSGEGLQSGRTFVWRIRPDAKTYDLLACSPLIVWYGVTILRQAPGLAQDMAKLFQPQSGLLPVVDVLARLAVLLFAAALVVMLVARRPAAAKVSGIFPRVAAVLGAYLGMGILTLPRHAIGWEFQVLSTLLILGGMGFALWGLLWLGRSFSILSEARRLVTGGPYAIVRHPLYLGEQVALLGVALQYLSPLALVFLAAQIVFQVCRMGFEEHILAATFPEYAGYMRRTRRLIPGVY